MSGTAEVDHGFRLKDHSLGRSRSFKTGKEHITEQSHRNHLCQRLHPKRQRAPKSPIIQSTTFKYATSEDMGKLFDLEASGYFYTRLQNPTNDYVAAKIAALEGGTAAMLTSSGQAANFFALFNIAGCGDHIVSSSSIYGGTFNLSLPSPWRKWASRPLSSDCTEEGWPQPSAPKGRLCETIASG